MTSRHRETDCETLFKDLKNWIRKPYSQESVAQQRSGNESLWECDSKTIPDADDGFGGRTPACREYTHPRQRANSRVYAAIPGNTIIGPVLQVHMVKFLDNYGIEIQIPCTVSQGQASWVIFMPRKEPIRGEFISPRSRTSPHEF